MINFIKIKTLLNTFYKLKKEFKKTVYVANLQCTLPNDNSVENASSILKKLVEKLLE